MSPEYALINAIEAIDADKSLTQPWKNYALSDARRALASLKMASGSIHEKPQPAPHSALDSLDPMDNPCICRPGMRNRSCPAPEHVS